MFVFKMIPPHPQSVTTMNNFDTSDQLVKWPLGINSYMFICWT